MIVGRGSFSIESWPIFRGTTFVLVPPKLLYVDLHHQKTNMEPEKGSLEKEKHLRIYQLFGFMLVFGRVHPLLHTFVCLMYFYGCYHGKSPSKSKPPFGLLFPTTKQANLSTSPLFMVS